MSEDSLTVKYTESSLTVTWKYITITCRVPLLNVQLHIQLELRHLPFSVGLKLDNESDSSVKSVSDLLLAATICHVDCVPKLLQGLVDKLKDACKNFTALVPDTVYLPAPPIYCPQPARDKDEV